MPIVGALPAAPEITLPERHLGLVSAINSATPESVFQRLGQMAVEWFDLDSIIALARSSPPLAGDRDRAPRAIARCPIGIAYDEAFHFYYQYNLAALEAAGAELVRFSPIRDRTLPAVAGLYFGGGYPETAARELSANLPMLQAIREFAAAGKPIYAECGGLMYLAEAIRTFDHETYPMAALIPGTAVMHSTLQALGYVEVTTTAPSLLGPTGTSWRGHQFRYSSLEPDAAAIERIYRVVPRWGAGPFAEGYRRANVIASYVHAHWASNPAVPAAFVQTCAEAADRRKDRFS
jgi:cobyrinic acid a,c-diamide synthase